MGSCNKVVDVVVGLLINEASQEVLITKRALHLHQGGLWEFPGGKIEPNETPEAALKREMREEIAIDVHTMNFLFTIEYDYPEKKVRLHTYRITYYTGSPQICDGQLDLRWVSLANWDSEAYPLPPPNQRIVSRIFPID